jgi:hypothetical protein
VQNNVQGQRVNHTQNAVTPYRDVQFLTFFQALPKSLANPYVTQHTAQPQPPDNFLSHDNMRILKISL